MDKRSYPRVFCSLPVDMSLPGRSFVGHYRTANVSRRGFFAYHTPRWAIGTRVEVLFHCPDEPIRVHAKVTRVGRNGAGFDFIDVDSGEQQALEHLVCPEWHGDDLLAGQLKLAPYTETSDFRGWLHLTSLLCTHPHIGGGLAGQSTLSASS